LRAAARRRCRRWRMSFRLSRRFHRVRDCADVVCASRQCCASRQPVVVSFSAKAGIHLDLASRCFSLVIPAKAGIHFDLALLPFSRRQKLPLPSGERVTFWHDSGHPRIGSGAGSALRPSGRLRRSRRSCGAVPQKVTKKV
jgi:hypothetical protein